MGMRFIEPPDRAAEMLRAHMGRLARHPRAPQLLRETSRRAIRSVEPHGVYDLRVDELAAGRGLEATRKSAVRFHVLARGEPFAAAEVLLDEDGGSALVASVNYGPFAAGTAQALRALARRPQLASETYEVRLLRCAPIYLMALWLKAETDGLDVVAPIGPAPTGLDPDQLYTPERFMAAVQVPIARRLEAHKA
jgi:hypothetical protein